MGDSRWSLVGATGRPLYRFDEGGQPAEEMIRISEDRRVTTVADGESLRLRRDQLLMAMARAQRDGASLDRIIHDFELVGEARHPRVLNRALALGRALLDTAIASGEEPAESILVLDIPKSEWDAAHEELDDTPVVGTLPSRPFRIAH